MFQPECLGSTPRTAKEQPEPKDQIKIKARLHVLRTKLLKFTRMQVKRERR